MAIELTRITQRQAPQFRALIKAEGDGSLFNPSTHLATAAELATEGIDAARRVARGIRRRGPLLPPEEKR